MLQVKTDGFIEARVYLNGDVAIGVVAWSSSNRSESAIHSVLKSLSLNMSNTHVDRRLWGEITQKENVPTIIKAAEVWLEKAHISPGNNWKAYTQLLTVRGWFATNECPSEFQEYDKRSYELSREVAGKLNLLFLEKRRKAMRALSSGQRKLYIRHLVSLQKEFPDRKDLRWIWAEKSKTDKNI